MPSNGQMRLVVGYSCSETSGYLCAPCAQMLASGRSDEAKEVQVREVCRSKRERLRR